MKSTHIPSTESRLQGLCFQWHWNQFPQYRGLLHMNDNTAHNAIKGTLNRAMGVVRGVSDLEYFYAGRTHFIELKSKEGIQSEKLFQSSVEAQGGRYHIVRSYEQFRQLIKAIHQYTQ